MLRMSFLAGFTATALMVCTADAQAANWSVTSPETSTCSPSDLLFAFKAYGSYTINNDVWSPCSGVAAGMQTIWANSYLDWGVSSYQPKTDGIKSYPHIGYIVNKPMSSLKSLTATISATTPATTPTNGAAWESTFDIWAGNKKHEIMVWLKYTGSPDGCGDVKPISANWTSTGCAIPREKGVKLSGATWNLYVGNNPNNQVYSFLLASKLDNGTPDHATIDVLEFMKYLQQKSYFDDLVIDEIQYGFEITSSPGGLRFASKNFDITAE
ncbi:glycosyl hydrolase [Paraburkholderia azotifigens]|uniref:GH12 family glycosyl hydrolase domain-containing protein n=1 Tax=Paraburkholderia azotifigens TaxID=2057004 RepID=UPI00317C4DE4